MIITGRQIKAARCLLGWNQSVLAEMSKVSLASIKRIEPCNGIPKTGAITLDKIEQTFRTKGVRFQNEDGRLGLYLVKEGGE